MIRPANWPRVLQLGQLRRRADRGRKPRRAAALLARGPEPPAAGARLVPVRRAWRGAEVRHAVALRDAARAARPELPLGRKHRGHQRRDLRRLCAGGRRRHRHGAAVLLVPLARNGGHAAAGQPQHDPEGRARAADHRLVQLRHRTQHHDGVRHLLLSDRADDRARPARSRAGPARPGAHAAGARAGSCSPRSSFPARCPTSSPA